MLPSLEGFWGGEGCDQTTSWKMKKKQNKQNFTGFFFFCVCSCAIALSSDMHDNQDCPYIYSTITMNVCSWNGRILLRRQSDWRYGFLRCHWINPKWSQEKLQVKSLTREWSSENDRLCCAGRGDEPLLITPPPPCASTKLSNLLKSAKSSCFSTLVWFTSNLSSLVEFSFWRLGVAGSLLAGGTLSPV